MPQHVCTWYQYTVYRYWYIHVMMGLCISRLVLDFSLPKQRCMFKMLSCFRTKIFKGSFQKYVHHCAVPPRDKNNPTTTGLPAQCQSTTRSQSRDRLRCLHAIFRRWYRHRVLPTIHVERSGFHLTPPTNPSSIRRGNFCINADLKLLVNVGQIIQVQRAVVQQPT